MSFACLRCLHARVAAATLILATVSVPAFANCGNDGAGFNAWLGHFKVRASADGISTATISSGLAGVTYDPTVIRLDRSQR